MKNLRFLLKNVECLLNNVVFIIKIADLDACIAVQAEPILADETLRNGLELSGHLAIIKRGNCSFVQKARRAQAAGCTGVVPNPVNMYT